MDITLQRCNEQLKMLQNEQAVVQRRLRRCIDKSFDLDVLILTFRHQIECVEKKKRVTSSEQLEMWRTTEKKLREKK